MPDINKSPSLQSNLKSVAIVASIIFVGVLGIYYIISQPQPTTAPQIETEKDVDINIQTQEPREEITISTPGQVPQIIENATVEPEAGKISGILKGPVVVNITSLNDSK